MWVALPLLFAAGAGVAAQRLGVPGGSILGAMLGAAAASAVSGRSAYIPTGFTTAALVVIGASVGIDLASQDWRLVVRLLPAAAASALLIISCGVAIGLLLRVADLAPAQPLLATSPGALSVLAGVAAERGPGASEVAVFHLLRIILVIASLPLLLRIMD